MRIMKMLLRLIALPVLIASLVVHVLLALVIGLSSIVTNLIGTFFIFGSIAGWLAHAAPRDDLTDGRHRHFLLPRPPHCRLAE